MKILHIVPSLLPESGGPSRAIPDLCRALTAVGTEVTLFSAHSPGNGLSIEPTREPYEVVLFPAKNGSLAGARQINKAIKARVNHFDLIHIHSLWNFTVTWAAAAAREVKIPYVIAPRGMLSETCLRQHRYGLKRAYAGTFERRTVESASRLHFLNEHELHASQNGWFRNPAHFVARNGVQVNMEKVRPRALRGRFPELEGRRIMIFLGRLHQIKGLDLQLQALRLLIPKYPDLIWLLVGPDDGEWHRLESLIQDHGLGAHVKWIGAVMGDGRFSALADADVLVQTSLYECQSMTVNEALAVGVPLVVTDSINYGEVQSAGAGYVVRRDPVEIAKAIDAILQDPAANEPMRTAGRRFAREELSWNKIARTLSNVYREVVSLNRTERSTGRRNSATAKSAGTG